MCTLYVLVCTITVCMLYILVCTITVCIYVVYTCVCLLSFFLVQNWSYVFYLLMGSCFLSAVVSSCLKCTCLCVYVIVSTHMYSCVLDVYVFVHIRTYIVYILYIYIQWNLYNPAPIGE